MRRGINVTGLTNGSDETVSRSRVEFAPLSHFSADVSSGNTQAEANRTVGWCGGRGEKSRGFSKGLLLILV